MAANQIVGRDVEDWPVLRTLLIATVACCATVLPPARVWAQDTSEEKKTPKQNQVAKDLPERLKVGDLAPPLNVTRWLQGQRVECFAPGKVYIVHFWATWCAPCIGHMPHLSKLQADYQSQGVSVIGYTTRDIRGGPGNSEAQVAAFLKRKEAILRYTVAYADERAMADAWLKGQDSFWTFVIDKTGRVAYMGHAMFLDLVLPKVLAGHANAKAIGDEVSGIIAEYEAMHQRLVRDFKAGNPAPGLKALKEFEAKYPSLADILPLAQAKLSLLPNYGKPGEGKAYARDLLARANAKRDFMLLNLIRSILRDQKEDKEFLAMAVEAAEAYVRFDPLASAQGWIDLADTYSLVGNASTAREAAKRATAEAAKESPTDRQEIEKEARRFGESP